MTNFKPIIVGLSGGIASGKNFVADLFVKKGAKIFDADLEVKKLLESDSVTIAEVIAEFPEVLQKSEQAKQQIHKDALAKLVFSDEKKLKILEGIIHPKLRQIYESFYRICCEEKVKILVLNIPLLLETKAYKSDYIIAITCAKHLRKKRFLARIKAKIKHENLGKKVQFDDKKLSELSTRFEAITAKQLKDSERKKAANFVLKTNQTKAQTSADFEEIYAKIISN